MTGPRGAWLTLAAFLWAGRVLAQPPAKDSTAQAKRTDSVTTANQGKTGSAQSALYSVPDIPAASFLGANPATVTRPSAPKDVLSSLLNGVDANGRVQQGVAVEISPLIIPGVDITPARYRDPNPFWYIVANTRLSFATARSSGDTSSTSAAIGLRVPILDYGDAMRDPKFRKQLALSIDKCKPQQAPFDTTGQSDSAAAKKRADSVDKALLTCIDTADSSLGSAYTQQHWNALRLFIAGAHGITFDSSYIKRERNLGDQLWAVAGVPATKFGEISGYAQLGQTDKHGTTPYFSTKSLGVRASIGSPTFDAFFEEVFEWRSTATATIARRSQSWTGGAEFLLTSNLWLSGGFGKPSTQGPTPQKVVVLAGIRWGLADKARFKPDGATK